MWTQAYLSSTGHVASAGKHAFLLPHTREPTLPPVNRTCPMTGVRLATLDLLPNHNLRHAIRTWALRRGMALLEPEGAPASGHNGSAREEWLPGWPALQAVGQLYAGSSVDKVSGSCRDVLASVCAPFANPPSLLVCCRNSFAPLFARVLCLMQDKACFQLCSIAKEGELGGRARCLLQAVCATELILLGTFTPQRPSVWRCRHGAGKVQHRTSRCHPTPRRCPVRRQQLLQESSRMVTLELHVRSVPALVLAKI